MNNEQQAARDAAWKDLSHRCIGQWVAVKDGYPLRSATYYVTLSNGIIGRSAFYCGAFDKDVIAWLPIPDEPYTPNNTEGE